MGGTTQHRQLGAGNQFGDLLGVPHRGEHVLAADHHLRGHRDGAELMAQGIVEHEDGTDLGGELLGLHPQRQRPQHADGGLEPTQQARTHQPPCRRVGQRPHPIGEGNLTPFLQQFTSPPMMTARRARQHQRAHPGRVADPKHLGQHPTHGGTHDVGRLHSGVVQHRHGVGGHHLEVIGPGRTIRPTHAAVVDHDEFELRPKGPLLGDPPAAVGTQALDCQQGLTVPPAEHPVVDGRAVSSCDERHKNECRSGQVGERGRHRRRHLSE